jgi:hypothetical protein
MTRRSQCIAAIVCALLASSCGSHDRMRGGERYEDEVTGLRMEFPQRWRDSVRVSLLGDAEREYFWPGSKRVVEILYEPKESSQSREPLVRIAIYPSEAFVRDPVAPPWTRGVVVALDSLHAYVLSAPRNNPYPPGSGDGRRYADFASEIDSLRHLVTVEDALELPEPQTPAQRVDSLLANADAYETRFVPFEMGDAESEAAGYFRSGILVLIDEAMNRGEYGHTREQYLVVGNRLAYFRRTGVLLWHDATGALYERPVVGEMTFDAGGTARILRYEVGGEPTEIRESEIEGIQRHFEYLRNALLEAGG